MLNNDQEGVTSWSGILSQWAPICALAATFFGSKAWHATHSILWTLLGVIGGAVGVLVVFAIAGSEKEQFQ